MKKALITLLAVTSMTTTAFAQGFGQFGGDGRFLGRLSANRFDANSSSNPFGRCGSSFSADSINNPFGRYGSPFSPNSVRNSYATQTPHLYGNDGKWLGKLSANRFDADSVSNPFGRYGSPFSADSINNPFGRYGSKFSAQSANNPFTIQAPIIIAPR